MSQELTIAQLEKALSNFQNIMVDEGGYFKLDDKFLTSFDELMQKLKESRALVEAMR